MFWPGVLSHKKPGYQSEGCHMAALRQSRAIWGQAIQVHLLVRTTTSGGYQIATMNGPDKMRMMLRFSLFQAFEPSKAARCKKRAFQWTFPNSPCPSAFSINHTSNLFQHTYRDRARVKEMNHYTFSILLLKAFNHISCWFGCRFTCENQYSYPQPDILKEAVRIARRSINTALRLPKEWAYWVSTSISQVQVLKVFIQLHRQRQCGSKSCGDSRVHYRPTPFLGTNINHLLAPIVSIHSPPTCHWPLVLKWSPLPWQWVGCLAL